VLVVWAKQEGLCWVGYIGFMMEKGNVSLCKMKPKMNHIFFVQDETNLNHIFFVHTHKCTVKRERGQPLCLTLYLRTQQQCSLPDKDGDIHIEQIQGDDLGALTFENDVLYVIHLPSIVDADQTCSNKARIVEGQTAIRLSCLP